MKEHASPPSPSGDITSPVLLRALELMKIYAKATGAVICVHNPNYMPIAELSREMTNEKNICLFCIKYRQCKKVKCLDDLSSNPCGDLHIKAIKESRDSGTFHIYTCELGFFFWTTPIYLSKHFAGVLTGSGFLDSDNEEVSARMFNICNGELSKTELRRMISSFPKVENRKIESLAELLLICAQSISKGAEDFHSVIKRRAEQQSDISARMDELKKLFPGDSPSPEYPFDKERRLLEVIKMGDIKAGKEILNEILATVLFSNPDGFKYIQCRAMELAVLLSRTDMGQGFDSEYILEANNHYYNSIREAKNVEEVTDELCRIMDEIAGRISAFQGIRHASALKKAEYYIMRNFTRKISLEEIAKASGFSAPYFSTIFKEGMGENLTVYINRLRVEKAGYMLVNTNFPLGRIAKDCGFGDQSWFSKIFKSFTGRTPGKFRSQGGKLAVKIPETGFSDDYLESREEQGSKG